MLLGPIVVLAALLGPHATALEPSAGGSAASQVEVLVRPVTPLTCANARLVVLEGIAALEPPCPCVDEALPAGLALGSPDCSCDAALDALRALADRPAPTEGRKIPLSPRGAALVTVPESGLVLAAEAPGCPRRTFALRPGGSRRHEVLLEPVAPARVTLLDPAGRPTAAAKVLLVRSRPLMAAQRSGGSFDVPVEMLPTADLTLRAEAPGCAGNWLEIGPAKSGVAEVRLQAAVSLTVSVLAAGKPLAQAFVVDDGPSLRRWARTDAKGRAIFGGVAVGTHTLWAAGGPLVAHLEVEATATQTLTLRAVRSASARGVVVAEAGRKPIAGVRVSAYDWRQREVTTDATGAFRIDGLFAGESYLTFQDPRGGYVQESRSVEAGAATKVEVALRRAGRVAGRVLDQEGTPVADARVEVWLPRRGPRFTTDVHSDAEAETGADGAFAFDGLPEGEATLLVTHVDHPRWSSPIAIPAAAPVEARLEPGALVDVEIRSPRGLVTRGCLEVDGNGCLFSREDGHFRGHPFKTGVVKLVLRASGFAPNAPPLELEAVPGRVVRTVLELATAELSVRGRVVDPKGQPVEGASLKLWVPGGSEAAGLESSKEDGSFAFDGLGPGKVTIRSQWPPGKVETTAGAQDVVLVVTP